MALSFIRNKSPVIFTAQNLLSSKLSKQNVANIVSKAARPPNYFRPPPYPYKTDRYGLLMSFIDKTSYRFDENTKIILVDGPVAAGKTAFAREIADALDMHYVPHFDFDLEYKRPYGVDLRDHDHEMPDCFKAFEFSHFLQDPNNKKSNSMQMDIQKHRLSAYIDALAHLFSTGQGVVLDRSFYSDFVFLETMAKFGFVTKELKRHYYEIDGAVRSCLMKPHLVIYLDMDVPTVLKKIQQRNIPYEKNSPFYAPEVLKYMEDVYKNQFLKEISKDAELLVYDWTKGGDTDVVVEDIEAVNLDDWYESEGKMEEWHELFKIDDESRWCAKRIEYTRDKFLLMNYTWNIPPLHVPELEISADDMDQFQEVLQKLPGGKYEYGFNAQCGDSVLFKSKTHYPKLNH